MYTPRHVFLIVLAQSAARAYVEGMARRTDIVLIQKSARPASILSLFPDGRSISHEDGDLLSGYIRNQLAANTPVIVHNCYLPVQTDLTTSGLQIYYQDLEAVIEVQGLSFSSPSPSTLVTELTTLILS